MRFTSVHSQITLDSSANSAFTFDMALRVLLADESSTIKKVMQLALSDFAVEVKSVPVGLDVLSVSKTFKPDIVFADVLLTKRSGYEVCLDLKMDPGTAHIPVVLMWSGFMDIDEDKASKCQADRRLEKPFDADHLRSIVNDLVTKTKNNPISAFLQFPDMPDFQEEAPGAGTPGQPTATAQESFSSPARTSVEDIYAIPEVDDSSPFEVPGEEFSAVPLTNPRSQDEAEEGGWSHQDLSKFKIQIPENENADFAAKFVIPQDAELDQARIEMDGEFEEISFEKPQTAKPTGKPIPPPPAKTAAPGLMARATNSAAAGTPPPPTVDSFVSRVEKSVKEQMMETLKKGPSKQPTTLAPTSTSSNAEPNSHSKVDLDPVMMEKVIREEAREIIESLCWKLIPDIAEREVREEINKLLKETEKNL